MYTRDREIRELGLSIAYLKNIKISQRCLHSIVEL